MKPHRLVMCLGVTLVAACVPTYGLTVNTNPQGALLVEEGTGAQFISPAVLTYGTSRAATEVGRVLLCPAGCGPLDERGDRRAIRTHFALRQLCLVDADHRAAGGRTGLEQDLAAAAAHERELELARINEEITRLEAQARAASSMQEAGYAMGCAIGGGCPRSPQGRLGTDWSGYDAPSLAPYQSPSMAPDRSYVMEQPTLCPDGTYVGAGGCSLTPHGSYVGGHPQLAPNGTYVGGRPTICPDGTYVGGSRCVMAPDGSYVGAP